MFEIAQKIIGANDAVALGFKSIDQVSPLVQDVQTALNNYPNLPSTYKGTEKIDYWVKEMSGKKATDELSDEENR